MTIAEIAADNERVAGSRVAAGEEFSAHFSEGSEPAARKIGEVD